MQMGGGWLAKGGGNSILARGRRRCDLRHRRLSKRKTRVTGFRPGGGGVICVTGGCLNEQHALRFAARARGGRSEEGFDHGRTGIWRRRTRGDGAERCAEHRAERVSGGGV